jgi:hypothetical protein
MKMPAIVITILLLVLCSISMLPKNCHGATILSDNFDSYKTNDAFKRASDWTTGSKVFLESSSAICRSGQNCARIDYVGQGYESYVLEHSVASHSLGEVYVSFSFKVRRNSSSAPQGGIKFCKLFGKVLSNPTRYANSTLNLGTVSTDPLQICGICYGRGTELENDTQDYIWFTGARSDQLVTAGNTSDFFFPKENQWYSVVVYMRYNTDGNRDGVYKVWVDGTLRLIATNVINRNNSDIRELDRISFGDYANQFVNNWSIWFDDVILSTEEPQGIETVGPITPKNFRRSPVK